MQFVYDVGGSGLRNQPPRCPDAAQWMLSPELPTDRSLERSQQTQGVKNAQSLLRYASSAKA
eukprot:5553657-Amphidinium_carterae.1